MTRLQRRKFRQHAPEGGKRFCRTLKIDGRIEECQKVSGSPMFVHFSTTVGECTLAWGATCARASRVSPVRHGFVSARYFSWTPSTRRRYGRLIAKTCCWRPKLFAPLRGNVNSRRLQGVNLLVGSGNLSRICPEM